MATICEIVNEKKRGCGYRTPGGLYLVGDGALSPCGKLPLALTVCACCGQGVKPARGWTWVSGVALFSTRACHGGECSRCILAAPPLRMGLLWIGQQFYPLPEDFVREGFVQGLSRRISAVPKGFHLGKTWVLFAHRRVLLTPTAERGPAIFGCFRPSRIEYVLTGRETPDQLEAAEARGLTLVRLVHSRATPETCAELPLSV